MKNQVLWKLLFCLLFSVITTVQADVTTIPAPITLKQCYEWALNQSEELRLRQESITQLNLSGKRALSGVYPKLSWGFVDTWQDPSGVRRLDAQGFSGFVQKQQRQSSFNLQQILFSGLSELSALKGFKSQSQRDQYLLEHARELLYLQTADSYYEVLSQQTEVGNAKLGLDLAEDRIKELSKFLRLGKARESELFAAQARLAALKANLQQKNSQFLIAKEDLSFLTGHDLSNEVFKMDMSEFVKVDTLADSLSRRNGRSDLKALREEIEAQRQRIRYEKGSLWPSVDLTGRYYTERATFMKEIKWDLALSLNVPLFQGGKVVSDIDYAKSVYRQAQINFEQLDRHIAHEIRRLHTLVTASREENDAHRQSVEAAQKSYDALKEEYSLGLVTNLDVLQALDLLLTQKSAKDVSFFNGIRQNIALLVATGQKP